MQTPHGHLRADSDTPAAQRRLARRPARPTTYILSTLLLAGLLIAAGAASALSPALAEGGAAASGSGAPAPTPLCPVSPDGPIFSIAPQPYVSPSEAAAAMDADGDFVVVWSKVYLWPPSPHPTPTPTNSSVIYGQRFNAAGVPQGPEFYVGSDLMPPTNHNPTVAMDADGDFVVVWEFGNRDNIGREIRARRFNASGEAQGRDFRVSTMPSSDEGGPDVAMDAAGNFVIAWHADRAVYVRRYDPAGNPLGPESLVSDTNYPPLNSASVAMSAGGFVITWADLVPATQNWQVYVRFYDSAGAPRGPASHVVTRADVREFAPAVAVGGGGGFVVAWAGRTGGVSRVYARRYDAGGVAQGPEFQVGAEAPYDQGSPTVAADADGNFAVAWTKSGIVWTDTSVYLRRYDAAGVPQGDGFLVGHTYYYPSVAMDADGDFAIVTSANGVNVRRYKVDCQTPVGAVVQFGSAEFNVTEGCVQVKIPVRLDPLPNAPQTEVTVDYYVGGGTASQRSDYTFAGGGVAPGQLTFAPGETTREINILINEDGYAETTVGLDGSAAREFVWLMLYHPVGAALGVRDRATLYINDNETVNSETNPIDEAENFVCQHYHDFLGRQPDAGGLAFWTNEITQCGADAACIRERRVNVSAAFYLSIEFQQRGYFVERLYEACLGQRSAYELVMRDLQRLGAGVEVGVGDWERRLEENKRAYAEEFVRRPEFLARYPESLTAEQYVSAMFAYASVAPTAAEVQAAVDAYGAGGTGGRASAMRQAMESPSVFRHYYNRGFVMAEYFGYLRRGPAEPPDYDWRGYDYWLQKMDDFSLPGEDVTREADALARVRRGEMVRAFIESLEYRQRFGRP